MALILVAEDERTMSLLVCAVMRREGWEVEATSSAMQTIARLRRLPTPDAIVLDLILGDGAAQPVVDALRDIPSTASVPVMLLSGASAAQRRAFCEGASIAGVSGKPSEPALVASTVRRALAGAGE